MNDLIKYITSHVSAILLACFLIILALKFIFNKKRTGRKTFVIDQISLGIGGSSITLKPNRADRQIAHKMWVELNTRKIGLQIDFENDVLIEIYSSWYSFFKITRELIKEIPVEQIGSKSGDVEFIDLAVDVLNIGLRPHLTLWQARFRCWYDNEIENVDKNKHISPQEIQKKFPQYLELKTDLEKVNRRLIYYKEQLRKISRGE